MANNDILTDYSWAENAMRCASRRIVELNQRQHLSWAHYRKGREYDSLNALYWLHWKHTMRG